MKRVSRLGTNKHIHAPSQKGRSIPTHLTNAPAATTAAAATVAAAATSRCTAGGCALSFHTGLSAHQTEGTMSSYSPRPNGNSRPARSARVAGSARHSGKTAENSANRVAQSSVGRASALRRVLHHKFVFFFFFFFFLGGLPELCECCEQQNKTINPPQKTRGTPCQKPPEA
jgi:hypothetical protein